MPSGTQVACECKEPNHSSNSNPFHEFGQGEKPNEALFNWAPLSLSLSFLSCCFHIVLSIRAVRVRTDNNGLSARRCVFLHITRIEKGLRCLIYNQVICQHLEAKHAPNRHTLLCVCDVGDPNTTETVGFNSRPLGIINQDQDFQKVKGLFFQFLFARWAPEH